MVKEKDVDYVELLLNLKDNPLILVKNVVIIKKSLWDFKNKNIKVLF